MSCTDVTAVARTACFNGSMQQDSFGSELRSYAAGGVRVCETLMPAGLRLAPHAHDSGQICFVLEGSYLEQIGGSERLLGPGMMHVRAPGQPHANAFASEEDVLALLISFERARWIASPLASPVRMLDDVAGELRRELRRGDEAAHTALEGLALMTMARVARMTIPQKSEPAWLGDALSLIERRSAGPLSLTTLAQAIGIRRGDVAAAFRRHRGTSVGESIRAMRVRNAKALLLTNMPLAEVALQSGFHDQAHFTRVFRALTGTTPGAYRSASSNRVSARKS
jgi:AraC family transcriptional regulator